MNPATVQKIYKMCCTAKRNSNSALLVVLISSDKYSVLYLRYVWILISPKWFIVFDYIYIYYA
jgi:hypothetical protein